MIAPPGFLERAVNDALGRVGHLALRNVEIVLFHVALPRQVAALLRAIRDPFFRPGRGGR
jgi:hypothetical protein